MFTDLHFKFIALQCIRLNTSTALFEELLTFDDDDCCTLQTWMSFHEFEQ